MIRVPRNQAIGSSSAAVRHYATPAKGGKVAPKAGGSRKKAAEQSSGPRGSRGQEGGGDVRLETIRKVRLASSSCPLPPNALADFFSSPSSRNQILYDSDPSDASRLAALAKVVPSLEAHQTIERAWALHKRHEREAHAAELARKYSSMRAAIDLLEETDAGLWDKSVGGKKFQNVDQTQAVNARLDGLVPREMRVPMEQGGTALWDKDWKSPKVEEGKL